MRTMKATGARVSNHVLRASWREHTYETVRDLISSVRIAERQTGDASNAKRISKHAPYHARPSPEFLYDIC